MIAIQQHPWFSDIDWEDLEAKKLKAPFIPDVKEANNFEFFDSEFTSEGNFLYKPTRLILL